MDGSIPLHPTKTIPTGLLSPRLALHITYIYIYTYVYRARSEGVNGERRDTGITGLPIIHLLSSVFSKRLGSISSSRTIHAVSPNLHYQSLTRLDVYIHFWGLTWQTTPKKYLGSISYFTHRVFLQIKISA